MSAWWYSRYAERPVFGGFDYVGAGGRAEPHDVLVGVVLSGHAAREGSPDVLPGQALTFGEGEGAKQIFCSRGVVTEAPIQVGFHGIAGESRQAGFPPWVAWVRRLVFGGEGAADDPGDHERGECGVGDRLGDLYGEFRRAVQIRTFGC